MVDKIENNKIKTRPHSTEAEEAVLGCMLLNKNAVSKRFSVLRTHELEKTNRVLFHLRKIEK